MATTEKIEKKLYQPKEAAFSLGIGITSLWELQQRHHLYRPFKFRLSAVKQGKDSKKNASLRGKKQAVFYTALQLEAIKQCIIGNKTEEDAYKEFMRGEKNIAFSLSKQLLEPDYAATRA